MTEQEIIEAAKTNWLCWQGLKETMPEVAEWMEKHKSEIRIINSEGALASIGEWMLEDLSYTYRLRPDYEPERWWLIVAQDGKAHVANQPVYGNAQNLKVTAEYADYLRNKPDGVECELREVDVGDTFLCTGDSGLWATLDKGECVADSWPYRWCKVKPKSGWREYNVGRGAAGYYVDAHERFTLHLAANSPTSLGLFGGVQFEGQAVKTTWYMSTAAMIDNTGSIYTRDINSNLKPAVPVKARFWQEVG